MRSLPAAPLVLTLATVLAGGSSTGAASDPSSPASALTAASPEALAVLQGELANAARQGFERLSAAGSWTEAEVDDLLELLLVDSARARLQPAFLERALPVATSALPEDAPTELLGELLVRLSRPPGLPLAALEELESAWGTIERRSLDRRIEPVPGIGGQTLADVVRWSDVGLGSVDSEIAMSIYSLGSPLFDYDAVEPFLRVVRRQAPDRAVTVLADHTQAQALEALADELDLHVSRTWGRSYSPWPRDAMSFLLAPDGHRIATLRPNRQATREDDSFMGLELIQDLPPELYDRLGPLSWAVAPIPFHNGNILHAPDRSWISIHSLEPRILDLLGLERVPVESFGSATGVSRYLDAARRAAEEMESLFGSPTSFVHPLPESADPAALAAAMRLLGRGAGFDLDSVLTLLHDPAAGKAALVADPSAGAGLIDGARLDEIEALRDAFGLTLDASQLRQVLASAQSSATAKGLADFLDLIARHLAAEGFSVRRLPLLWVPTSLLERPGDYPDPAFLLGWNNVVLESRGNQRRAEGFASRLQSGDRLAEETFAELGYELVLVPPLIESVLRNGGYRCASNHLRALD